jgi:hypothetical protein
LHFSKHFLRLSFLLNYLLAYRSFRRLVHLMNNTTLSQRENVTSSLSMHDAWPPCDEQATSAEILRHHEPIKLVAGGRGQTIWKLEPMLPWPFIPSGLNGWAA